jgi:hypothetical protein
MFGLVEAERYSGSVEANRYSGAVEANRYSGAVEANRYSGARKHGRDRYSGSGEPAAPRRQSLLRSQARCALLPAATPRVRAAARQAQ